VCDGKHWANSTCIINMCDGKHWANTALLVFYMYACVYINIYIYVHFAIGSIYGFFKSTSGFILIGLDFPFAVLLLECEHMLCVSLCRFYIRKPAKHT
jgi:hypothetical protein